MAGRRRAVLVVDTTSGLTGLRRTAGRASLPGGIEVVSAAAGPGRIPADLVPTEIHFAARQAVGRGQAELLDEVFEVLMERAGFVEHAHYAEPAPPAHHTEPLRQSCRCGARRERPRGPYDWSDWT